MTHFPLFILEYGRKNPRFDVSKHLPPLIFMPPAPP
jgi:hypothetical protein